MSIGDTLRSKYPNGSLPPVEDPAWRDILLDGLWETYAPLLAGLAFENKDKPGCVSRPLEGENRWFALHLFAVEPFRDILENTPNLGVEHGSLEGTEPKKLPRDGFTRRRTPQQDDPLPKISGLYMQGSQLTLHLWPRSQEQPFPNEEPGEEFAQGTRLLRGLVEQAKKHRDRMVMTQLFPKLSAPHAMALGLLVLGNFRAWVRKEVGTLRLLPENFLEVSANDALPPVNPGRIGHFLCTERWPRS